MQQSPQIEITAVTEIRELHIKATNIANKAHEHVLEAVNVSRQIGKLLNDAKLDVPNYEWTNWLRHNFGESFIEKAKVYRKAHDTDPRQIALALNVVPAKAPKQVDSTMLVKPAAHINWINKVTGYLRRLDTLPHTERVVLADLVRQLDRLGVPPSKESL